MGNSMASHYQGNRLDPPASDAYRTIDLAIIGGGFAGLVAARAAALRGLSVAVLDAKTEPGARVHTTGILVPEAADAVEIPYWLTRPVPGVRLYAPDLRHADLICPGYAFFTTRTADLLRWLARQASLAGATLMFGYRFREATCRPNGLIHLPGTDLQARYIIGADGARSRVARAFGLDVNQRFLTGLELELDAGEVLDPRFLHCFINAEWAPGYIAWAAPGPEALQLGLAVRHGAKPNLNSFYAQTASAFGWKDFPVLERRSGLIPCGGPLTRFAGDRVMLVGDAAGWVSPATAGGIRTAFQFGRAAALAVADHLQRAGPRPDLVMARQVPQFRAKSALRLVLDSLPAGPMLNPAFNIILGSSLFRRFAEQIYFHRRGARGITRTEFLTWLENQSFAPPRPLGTRSRSPKLSS